MFILINAHCAVFASSSRTPGVYWPPGGQRFSSFESSCQIDAAISSSTRIAVTVLLLVGINSSTRL